ETESAKDGAEALIVLLQGKFDLILLDMHMPRMGGLELLKQVRGLGVNVPVIMITANADNKAAAEALSGGVFAYIPKPFDIRHLERFVGAPWPEFPASAERPAGGSSSSAPRGSLDPTSSEPSTGLAS